MADYQALVSGTEKIQDLDEYFLKFFDKKNLKDYAMDPDLNKEEKKAVRVLFESKRSMKERAEAAFEYDPLCREAFFVYLMLTEDVFLQYRFDSYYKQADNFVDFSAHQKKSYLEILDYYIDFLDDIGNVTGAIRIAKMKGRLDSFDESLISRLSLLYFYIEDAQEFYRLYLNHDFSFEDYLLLVATLLKHQDENKAKEVLLEMFEHVPYSDYIDHLWDLDEKDEEQRKVIASLESVYEYLASVPTLFSWANKVKRDSGRAEEE